MTDDISEHYAELLGAVESPKDERDYRFSTLLTPEQQEVVLPSSWVAPPIPPNLKQKGGTCVGFSSTAMRLSAQKRDLGAWLPLDPYNLYKEAKKRDGLPPGVEGSTVRASMRALREYGQLLVGNRGNPVKNRVASYYAVARDYDELRRAIKFYGGVVIATPWYAEWLKPGRNGVLPEPRNQIGGHAIYALGWGERGLLLRNSWGREWGITGNCFLPAEYVPDIWEAWRTIDQKG